jgi:hypothetical protein
MTGPSGNQPGGRVLYAGIKRGEPRAVGGGQFAQIVIAYLLVRSDTMHPEHGCRRQLFDKAIAPAEARGKPGQRQLCVGETGRDGFVRHRYADETQLGQGTSQHHRGFLREPGMRATVQAVHIPEQADQGVDVEQAGLAHSNSALRRAISAAETLRAGRTVATMTGKPDTECLADR